MSFLIVPNSSADLFSDLKAKAIQKATESFNKDINTSDNKPTATPPSSPAPESISSNTDVTKKTKPQNNSSLGAGPHVGMSSVNAKNACRNVVPSTNKGVCFHCLITTSLIGTPT